MKKLGLVYVKDDKSFVVDRIINNFDDRNGTPYALCYEVVLTDSHLRSSDNAYRKIGKPFIVSVNELPDTYASSLLCENCLHFGIRQLKLKCDYCSCRCSQNESFTTSQYVQFVPACKLFRPKNQIYEKSFCDDAIISAYMKSVFDGCNFENLDIIKNGNRLFPSFGIVGSVFTEELFEEIFSKYTDKNVLVVNAFLSYVYGKGIQNAYTVSRETFDYTFYLHECKLLDTAYLFCESKVAVVSRFESVYLLDLPDYILS